MAFLNTYLPSHEATPSLADLERYVQGKMGEEEQSQFEATLAEDPMLADAVEGLRGINDPESLRRRIKQLQQLNQRRIQSRLGPDQRQDERSKRKSRVRPLYLPQMLMGAAAVIVLLFLGVNMFRSFSERNEAGDMTPENLAISTPEPEEDTETPAPLASAEEPERSEPAPVEVQTPVLRRASSNSISDPLTSGPRDDVAGGGIDSPIPMTEEMAGAETSLQSEMGSVETWDMAYGKSVEEPAPQPAVPGAVIPSEPNIAVMMEEVQTTAAQRDEEIAGRNAAEAEEERMREPISSGRRAFVMAESVQPDEQAADFDEEAATVSAELSIGRSYHQQQQWEKSREYLQRALSANSTQAEVLFLIGDSHYREGEVKEAIPYLMRVMPHQQPFYDQAQWVLALCADAQGNRQTALNILRQLAGRDGRYRVAAQQLIATWTE